MMRLTGDPHGPDEGTDVLRAPWIRRIDGGAFAAAGPAAVALYDGARLIVGDGGVIEDGAFVVRDGRIVALGRKGAVSVPAGAARVDLTGKTVMPAMINAHVHIGYEGYTSWGAENYTPQNVLDHLEREAFYGVGATQSVGSSPLEPSLQFERDQRAGKFPPASRFFFMPGMAPPNGGPDAILMKGTSVLHAVNEVSTAAEARAAVAMMAGRQLKHVKIWVDDRRGTYPKMTPEVYNAVIDEAHKRHMLVHAHAIALDDQKAVVRAGADVLVHTVANEKLDEELIALLKEKKPYWTTVIGLGDRSEACDGDPFVDQSYPRAGARRDPAERAADRCRRTPPTARRCSPTTCRRWSPPARAWCSAPTPASRRATRSAGPITTRSRAGWSWG